MTDKIQELSADLDELRTLLKDATRQKVKDVLSIEIRKLETQLIALKDQQQQPSDSSGPAAKPKQPSTASNTTAPVTRLRDYAWDQSDKFVKFYLTLPGVHSLDANLVSLTTTRRSCVLQVCFPDKTCVFSLENLLEEISTDKSYHKVKTDSLVVFLKKEREARRWSHVTATEKQLKEARDAKKADDLKPASDDPSAGIMNLMKKMYDDGDDDMKRTIAKAWTEAQDKKTTGLDGMPGAMPGMPGADDFMM